MNNSYQRALCKVEEYQRNNFNSGCCCVGTPGPTARLVNSSNK